LWVCPSKSRQRRALSWADPEDNSVVRSDARQHVDYKTHILIGVRSNGSMTVLCHWPHVPRQSEVQHKIASTHEHYDTYVLCTPTSVMSAQSGGPDGPNRGASRPFGFR
jgi:hypothetical protein